MGETSISEIPTLDLGHLAEQLHKLLLLDAIATNPLQVRCSLSDEILIIVIQYDQTPSLEATAIVSCVQEFLSHQDICFVYPTEIYLTASDVSSLVATESINHETSIMVSFPAQKKTSSRLTYQKADQLSLFAKNYRRIPRIPRKASSNGYPTKNLLALGLGLGVIAISFYGLSDPCVTGTCPPLSKAEFLAKSSLISLDPNLSTSLLTAKQQLDEAIQQLQFVPWWSPFHSKASSLEAEYQAILRDVNQLSGAIASGNQATLLIEKTSLTVPEWQTAQTLLKNAIDQFKTVSPQSRFQSFAIAKKQEYEKALQGSDRRLQQEQLANLSYEQARKIATLAKVQENMAQSVDDFGVTSSTWKKAIQSLQKITEGTTPYNETSKLLERYSQEYKNIDTRTNQEKMAKTNHQQALEEARIAEKSQKANQWSSAISHWKNALNYLKQIPDNTFVSVKTKPLAIDYSLSLKKAQEKFSISNRLQLIKNNLNKICSQEGKACDYSIDKNIIQVKLTSSYLQQIWDLSIQAKLNTNIKEQAEILNHLSRLEQDFQLVSNQAKMPLVVYNAKGELLMTYKPVS